MIISHLLRTIRSLSMQLATVIWVKDESDDIWPFDCIQKHFGVEALHCSAQRTKSKAQHQYRKKKKKLHIEVNIVELDSSLRFILCVYPFNLRLALAGEEQKRKRHTRSDTHWESRRKEKKEDLCQNCTERPVCFCLVSIMIFQEFNYFQLVVS